MANVLVSIYSWENPKIYRSNIELKKDDKVIVPMENGNELGIVLEIDVKTKDDLKEEVVRKATKRDAETYEKYEKEKDILLDRCRKEIKESQLPMKVKAKT